VHTGLFGGNETFVSMQGADVAHDGRVTVAYDKAVVKDAPSVDEDGHLSVEDEQQLYRYYSLDGSPTLEQGGEGRRAQSVDDLDGTFAGQDRGAVGHDTSGPTTDAAMTRSEEQLNVGTETRETGRARLRKHVVTEQEQVTVPVSHEEIRVEREPITDANRGDALDEPAISEEEHEVVLREERQSSTPRPSRSSGSARTRTPCRSRRPSAARSARRSSRSTTPAPTAPRTTPTGGH
jgi:uncharacterized protein (TIGR02271 family)